MDIRYALLIFILVLYIVYKISIGESISKFVKTYTVVIIMILATCTRIGVEWICTKLYPSTDDQLRQYVVMDMKDRNQISYKYMTTDISESEEVIRNTMSKLGYKITAMETVEQSTIVSKPKDMKVVVMTNIIMEKEKTDAQE